MLSRNVPSVKTAVLLTGLLTSGIFTSTVSAQSPAPATPAVAPSPAAAGTSGVILAPRRYRPNRFPKRALAYYENYWGVDSLKVKSVESGEIIRFTYRVLDAEKARILNDKKLEPSLTDPKARVRLVVPSLEKVGQLRQSSTPQAGMAYWMAFSNKGRLVKRGDSVSVVIGQFHADGLVVE